MARCVLRRLSSAGSYCPPGTINPIACGAGNYVLELCVLLERAVQCPGGASSPTGVPLGELLAVWPWLSWLTIRVLRDWCKCHNDVSHCLVPSVSAELSALVAELAMQRQIQCHDQRVWCHGLSGMLGRHRAGHVRFEHVHSVQPWHLRHRQRPHQLQSGATRLLCLLCGWWCGKSIAGRQSVRCLCC